MLCYNTSTAQVVQQLNCKASNMQNATVNTVNTVNNASARKARMQALLEEYAVLLQQCEEDTTWTVDADTLGHAKESLHTLLVYTDYADELFSGSVA